MKSNQNKKTKPKKQKNPTSLGKTLMVMFMCLIAALGLTFAFSMGPKLQKESVIAHSKISTNYTPEVYEGWVYADVALHRENDILYSHNPHTKNSNAVGSMRDYPSMYLPDLIDQYGISVQKPYTGTYIFNTQKQQLLNFYNNEEDVLLKAETEYKPMYGTPTANDAEVVQALNAYLKLLDKLDTATSKLTLKQAQNKPIGYYIQKEVGETDLSLPLAYGQVATQYLDNNINAYQKQYEDYLNNADTSKPEIQYVQKVLGLNNN